MPQFQFAQNLIPQLAWLAVFFTILYFGIVRLTLPKLGRVISAREGQVSGDLAAAETAKNAADAAATEHKAAIDAAHASGRSTILDAQSRAAANLASAVAATQAELLVKQGEADKALTARRNAALAEVDGAAQDVAADIVARLTGKRPAAGVLTKAAKAAQGA
ncbi:ATP synthase subunit b [Sphingomonas antarctica]|uniref:F0F1 ATP synthase subunit B family protein n=1 Tax=Sphingomonas antarctica TaxID=2040274 RepID=UPI0039ECE8E1